MYYVSPFAIRLFPTFAATRESGSEQSYPAWRSLVVHFYDP